MLTPDSKGSMKEIGRDRPERIFRYNPDSPAYIPIPAVDP
jgi:hypothetical protein